MKQQIKLVGTEEFLKFRRLRNDIMEADRKTAELWKRKLELKREIEDIDQQIRYYQSVNNNTLGIYTDAVNSNNLWVNDEQTAVAQIINIENGYHIEYTRHDEDGEHKYFTSARTILSEFPNPINEDTFRRIRSTWQK